MEMLTGGVYLWDCMIFTVIVRKVWQLYTGLFCTVFNFAFFPSHFKWKIITYDRPVETKDHMIFLSEHWPSLYDRLWIRGWNLTVYIHIHAYIITFLWEKGSFKPVAVSDRTQMQPCFPPSDGRLLHYMRRTSKNVLSARSCVNCGGSTASSVTWGTGTAQCWRTTRGGTTNPPKSRWWNSSRI